MSFLRKIAVFSLIFGHVSAQNFSLYPAVDPVKLAAAFNISTDCLDALNTSLPCDQTLLQMAGSVDNYYWEEDNLTALCTRECYNSVQDWNSDVGINCYYDELVAYNMLVPATSVSGRIADGMDIACLTNQNSTEDLDFSYCLIESQDWVGSDIVRPDCSVDSSDPSCSDPTNVSPENERMANLYTDDVLCSECFIQMMYQRLSSQYLPDHDFSDYLIAQYQDILDVCNATDNMPELVIRAPPEYVAATPVPLNFSGIPPPDTSCTGGQWIVPSTLDPKANCATISQAFNVATGAIQAATNSTTCTSTANYCLPAACTLHQVADGDTCDTLANSLSTSNLTISTLQLLTWNPDINGLCDDLTAGDNICASPPGGSYVPPPPPAGSASDDNQQRGGGGGGGDGGGGSNNNGTLLCTQQPTPAPVQDGISSACTKWCQAVAGDYCYKFAQEANITTDSLYTLNPVLGSGGSNCSAQFQAGYWYCVAS